MSPASSGTDSRTTTRSLLNKAVENFASTNYDNNMCGVYINIPNGKFYSSDFMHNIMTEVSSELINDSQICI